MYAILGHTVFLNRLQDGPVEGRLSGPLVAVVVLSVGTAR